MKKMVKVKEALVIYSREYSDELIVMPVDQEKKLVRQYFGKNKGRSKKEWERSECNDLLIGSELHLKLYHNF